MDNQIVDIKKVFIFAGAFIAFLIGSGFATGQEILQYFASYGYMGILGAVVVFILFVYVGVSFITTGQKYKFKKGNEIYTYYCGSAVGKFFDYFSIIFIYMSYIVMISGAGATINQQYNLSIYIGGIIMATLSCLTVIFGLGKIVDIIGKIGPLIVILSILLGISAIAMRPEGLVEANKIIPELNLLKASNNWFLAAASYVGFCMLWLASFMASMGATANSKKEAALGAIAGAFAFSAAVIIVALGLIANIEQVSNTMIPSLCLAENIHPNVAIFFSVTIIAGIYTTAVPLLWSVSSRVAEDRSKKFVYITIILAIIGAFVGLVIPFNKLVNIVYVINGYVGFILLILMVIKDIRARTNIL